MAANPVYTASFPVPSPKAIVYLLHGLGEHSGQYTSTLIKGFNGAGLTVHAMDLRGHGRTSLNKRGDTGNLKTIVDDLEENLLVLDQDAKVPKLLFGHSLGGLIMLHYSLCGERRKSFAGLMLSAPAIKANNRPNAVMYFLMKQVGYFYPSFTVDTNIGKLKGP